MSLIERIRIHGLAGLEHRLEGPSEHAQVIEQAQKEYPALCQLIGVTAITVGSGWSIGISKRYTLTMEGIEQIIQMLKVKAFVAIRLDQIHEAIARLSDNSMCAVITTSDLMKNFLGMESDVEIVHAISVFIQKKNGHTQLFINDSQANKYPLAVEKDRIDCFATCMRRQPPGESTCGTFAITDCIAFQEDPKLIEKISQLNGALPDSMKTLDPVAARKKTIDFELLLIEAEIKKGGGAAGILVSEQE